MAVNKGFLVTLTIVICVLLFYVIIQLSSYDGKGIVNQVSVSVVSSKTNISLINSQSINNDTKTILLWMPMFGSNDWGAGYDTPIGGPDFFAKRNCPLNCAMTLQRDLLPSVDQFDAIVFHGVPDLQMFLPSVRAPHQLYVHGILEAPPYVESRWLTWHPLGHLKNFYNLTMSFRLDADIFWPYLTIEDLNGNVVAPDPHHETNWIPYNTSYYNQELYEIAVNKTKKIAWFASNCNGVSGRNELVTKISNLMPVDIYGACGPFKCPRTNGSKCFKMLETDYKFYLGFENSLCTDYVTEKLLDYMKYLVVPVVFGGANYTRYAPPHSYIDANDYETPDELVKYLEYLDENPMEYIKYFWWRDHYAISKQLSFPFCDLCKKLHDKRYLAQTKYYHDVNDIPWSSAYMCQIKPRIKF